MLIGYVVLTSRTMIYPTPKGILKVNIETMLVRDIFCLPEKSSLSKFGPKHETVNGSEATAVLGEDAEPEQIQPKEALHQQESS